MPGRYIVSAATLAALRQLIPRNGEAAAIGFREDNQTVYIVDPATGDEVVLGTFNGAVTALALAQNHIIVGDAGGLGADVAVSGDLTAVAGALTVQTVGGATKVNIAAASAAIAALPVANVAAPAIWNDAGVLKVGTL